jgi:hypothetical protein
LAGINLLRLSERPSGQMVGWMKWAAIALAVAGLVMGGATLGVAGDSTVAVKRLGPPDVEARREALLKQMIAARPISISPSNMRSSRPRSATTRPRSRPWSAC